MVLIPLMERELRAAARRRSTYVIRVAVAGAALLVAVWVCLLGTTAQAPAELGRSLFNTLMILVIGYGLLTGPFVSSDCLSEERRDGTLGLLLLTDLRPMEILIGKWISSSLSAFYGLLALLPWLGLPLLFGGVTPAEYGRAALAGLNAILFSLSAGFFISSLNREQAKSAIATAILVLSVAGLIPGFYVLASIIAGGKVNVDQPLIALISPAYTSHLALDSVYKAKPHWFWISIGLGQSMTWFFLLATAVKLPGICREDPSDPPSPNRWRLRFGYTTRWLKKLSRWRERNPVWAAAARQRWPVWVTWSLVLVVTCNVYWLTYGYRKSPGSYTFHSYFSYAMYFINRIWIALLACRFFLEARRTGALEILLTTPVPVATILRGHRKALTHYLLLPVLIIAFLHAFYVLDQFRQTSGGAGITLTVGLPRLQMHYYITAATGSLVSFLGDVVALSAMGAWLTLGSRRPNLAALMTFALVVLGPWLMAYYLPRMQWAIPGGSGIVSFFPGGSNYFYYGRPLLWLAKNLVFLTWAAWKLRRHFRQASAEMYESSVTSLLKAGLTRMRKLRGVPTPAQLQPGAPLP